MEYSLPQSKKTIEFVLLALFYTVLALFSFGQLFRVDFGVFHFQLLDLVLVINLIVVLFSYPKLFTFLLYKSSFVWAIGFTTLLLLSTSLYQFPDIFEGLMYTIRLIAILGFLLGLQKLVLWKKVKQYVLQDMLILISFVSGLFGLTQYTLLPDLRFMKYLGWDDHLYRLTGTYYDPGFIGIILLFGLILVINRLVTKRGLVHNTIFIGIFLISILLTYSRATYLAFFISATYFFIKKTASKLIVTIIVLFLVLIPLLPKGEGEGVKLERTSSIYARFENYQDTFLIIQNAPVFGIGYNMLCPYKVIFQSFSKDDHSCSGSDSSLLYVLATTGCIGIFALAFDISQIYKRIETTKRLQCKTILIALLVHSIFVQSMFYLWVMIWVGIYGVSILKPIDNR